jgi:hypothetical protein
VLARLVVAELAGGGEALEHLQARLLQLGGAHRDALFELQLGLSLPELQAPDLQEVAHAEADLVLVERLGQEVPRAARERHALDLVGRVAGEDEDGQRDRGRDLLVELLHDREAVGLGHVEVEQRTETKW